MKNCDCDAATLAQYLDGELPSDQANRMQEHIGDCPHCAAEVSVLVSMKRSLHAANRHFTPSAEFRRKIQQQVARPQNKWNPRLAWPSPCWPLSLRLPPSGWCGLAAWILSVKSQTCT